MRALPTLLAVLAATVTVTACSGPGPAGPIIEGSNIGIRRRQLQDLFRTPGYNPLSASGMA